MALMHPNPALPVLPTLPSIVIDEEEGISATLSDLTKMQQQGLDESLALMSASRGTTVRY